MVIKLDGTDDYIQCGNDALFWSRALTKFSFSIWVYSTANVVTADRYIISHGNGTAQGFRLIYVNNSNKISFLCKNAAGTNFDAVSNLALPLNKWTLLTGVYDNSLGTQNIKLYVDGVLQTDTGNLTETLNLSAILTLGTDQSANSPNIYMKDFRFWKNKALSAAEALQLYEGRDESQIEPDYWLAMDETEGNPKSYGLRGIRSSGIVWDHKSLLFDGSDTLELNGGVEPTLWGSSMTKLSFSFWAKFQETTSSTHLQWRTIISMWDTASGFGLTCFQDALEPNKIFFDMSTAVDYQFCSSTTINKVDKWYQVTCVYDSTLGSNHMKIYVDGALGSVTGGTVGTFNVPLALFTMNNHFGNIKEFRFWKGIALTATDAFNLAREREELVVDPSYRLQMEENKSHPKDHISNPRTGTLTNGADWAYNSTSTKTSDPSYQFPLAMKLVIKSNDENDTYFRYDSYGSKPFKVIGLKLTMADSETNMAILAIEDGDDLLNNSKLAGGVKYFISLAAGNTIPYEDMFSGFGELMEVNVEGRNTIYKFVTILGAKVLALYRFLNYHRSAKLNALQDPASVSGKEFESWFHVDRAISKTSELLYNKIIIKDKAHWENIDLHEEINTVISGISLGVVNLWDFMEYQRSITGGHWGVDFTKGKERFYYQFPELNVSDIIFKSAYEMNKSVDLANNTSYIYPAFTYNIDTTPDINHSTILHGITDIDDVFIAGSSEAVGNTNLTFKALVQYLPLPVDARRISKVNLMLSMKGEVTSPNNRVNGVLCLPDANGKPLGTKLDKFEIPLSDIKKNPEVISVDVDVDPDEIKGNTEVCIKLYNRSSTDEEDKGEPNHDEKNTILWYHNNKTNVSGQYKSGSASGGDKSKEPLTWLVKDTGPVFACSLNSDIQRIQTIMTPSLFPQYGVKEYVMNVSELRDKTSVNLYMQYKAWLLSLPKTYIPTIKCKIPNNRFFKPTMSGFMTVAKPLINSQMRIKRVTYDLRPIDEHLGENQASRICTLSLEGSYNPANNVKFNCDN